MKTLNKIQTRQFFLDEEGYETMVQNWKDAWNTDRSTLRSIHFLLYSLLRGRNCARVFTPITNTKKLENGLTANETSMSARYGLPRALKHEIFAGLTVPALNLCLRVILDLDNSYTQDGLDYLQKKTDEEVLVRGS